MKLTVAILLGATLFALPLWGEKTAEKVVSPDGRIVAWIASTPGSVVATGAGEEEATELWVQDVSNGSKHCILRGRFASDAESTIAGMSGLRFSRDGTRLFFSSAAWATSSAVHVVDLATGRERFVIDGSLVGLVTEGHFSGDLLVARSAIKTAPDGESLGRCDYLWIITADGFPVIELCQGGAPKAMQALLALRGIR